MFLHYTEEYKSQVMSDIKTGWCSDNDYVHVLVLEQVTFCKKGVYKGVCSPSILNFINELTLRATLPLNKHWKQQVSITQLSSWASF